MPAPFSRSRAAVGKATKAGIRVMAPTTEERTTPVQPDWPLTRLRPKYRVSSGMVTTPTIIRDIG